MAIKSTFKKNYQFGNIKKIETMRNLYISEIKQEIKDLKKQIELQALGYKSKDLRNIVLGMIK